MAERQITGLITYINKTGQPMPNLHERIRYGHFFTGIQLNHARTTLLPRTYPYNNAREGFDATRGWYEQEGPSCIAWAIANGIHALGVSLSQEQGLITKLHIDSVSPSRNVIQGGELFKAQKTVNSFATQVEMTTSRLRTLNPWQPEAAEKNVKLLQEIINTGGVLIVAVNSYKYIREGRVRHALCVSGYSIENGLIQLQVIDPTRGVLWMPIEHLFYSMVPDENVHILRKF